MESGSPDWATLLSKLTGCCSNNYGAGASSSECSVWRHIIYNSSTYCDSCPGAWLERSQLPTNWWANEGRHGLFKPINVFGAVAFVHVLWNLFKFVWQKLDSIWFVTVQAMKEPPVFTLDQLKTCPKVHIQDKLIRFRFKTSAFMFLACSWLTIRDIDDNILFSSCV